MIWGIWKSGNKKMREGETALGMGKMILKIGFKILRNKRKNDFKILEKTA